MVMERLDAAKGLPENQDSVKQSAIEEAKRLLTFANVKDPGPKIEVAPASSAEVRMKPQVDNPSLGFLEQAVKKFKENPQTLKAVTEYWQTVWKVWGEKVNIAVTVPACDRSAEEIKQLEDEGRKLVYVPDEVASQENRHLLGNIFPEIQSYSVNKDNSVTNESNQGGWFDIEASVDSPNLGSTQRNLEDLFKKQRKAGQRLNTYIIGSQDSILQTNHYFDENTWSRLLGSSSEGHVVYARFNLNRRLDVRWRLSPRDPQSHRGGRSEGIKKA